MARGINEESVCFRLGGGSSTEMHFDTIIEKAKRAVTGFFSGFAKGYGERKAARLELEGIEQERLRAEREKSREDIAQTRQATVGESLNVLFGFLDSVFVFLCYLALLAVGIMVVSAVVVWAYRTLIR